MNIPRGKLIIIGGNESKEDNGHDPDSQEQQVDFKKGVLREVLRGMRVKKPSVVILPVASSHQQEIADIYVEAFGKIGTKPEVIIINSKEEVDNVENLEIVARVDGIFITGGDQAKIIQLLSGTLLLEILHERYLAEDFVIAGTSAGAMIMSEYMIDTGSSEESIIKGIIKLKKGFDFLGRTIIDTHFFNRGRFARLTEGLLQKKNLTGIGISEDTALVVTDGNMLQAIGSGTVIIMENHEVRNTNYNIVRDKDPVYIENLIVHILSRGSAYLLMEKKFLVL
jgi:cyanophycinase